MEHTPPRFTIIRVYASGELVAETDDDRLREFSWCWGPSEPEEVVLIASTATELRWLSLDEAEQARMTPQELVRFFDEHYRDPAHVDELIARWFELVDDEPKELDELLEDEQWRWANGR